MVAAEALHTGLFASAEAQQETESRDHQEAEQAPAPGKTTLGGNDLHSPALGTEAMGSLRLDRNVDRLHRGVYRLSDLGFSGFGWQFTATAFTKTVNGIIGDLDTAVFTTHDHSSFLTIIEDGERFCNKVLI